MKKKLPEGRFLYLRDLTVINIPKGIYVEPSNTDVVTFKVCRKTYGVPPEVSNRDLGAYAVKRLLRDLEYDVPKNFLLPEIFDTTGITVKERGIEYRMPIPNIAAQRIIVPLAGSINDVSRAIAAVVKIRSFHKQIMADLDPSTLISWVMDDTPHHNR